MSNMKVVMMTQFGSSDTLAMQEMAKPEAKEGEVRIRIKAAAFNPVDWKIREGWFGGNPQQVLGSDCSGVVDAVGPNVAQLRPGDEVYGMTFIRGSNGSYAEYVVLPQELVAKKPKNLTFEEAASVPLAAMTAYRATWAVSSIKKGDTVFIAGVGGGVGNFAVQLAKHAGAKTIHTLAKDEKSAQFMQEKLGIEKEHITLYEKRLPAELRQTILAKNEGRLFNATFDFVGGETKKLCLELTQFSGHFATILSERENFSYPVWTPQGTPFAKTLSLHMIFVGAELIDSDRRNWAIYQQHMKAITELLESGKLQKPIISVLGTLNLPTVKQAHAMLQEGRVKGKLVMTVA